MTASALARIVTACLLIALPWSVLAEPASAMPAAPARVMLLGLFHFDNPGLDAVKYTPRDVMQADEQKYLVALSERLARFAPTRVLFEYPPARDAVINERYADYLADKYELPTNEIYQLGFRVAKLAGLTSVNGFDAETPPFEAALWANLATQPALEKRVNDMIGGVRASNSDHRTLNSGRSSPEQLAARGPAQQGLLHDAHDVAAANGLFHGAHASRTGGIATCACTRSCRCMRSPASACSSLRVPATPRSCATSCAPTAIAPKRMC